MERIKRNIGIGAKYFSSTDKREYIRTGVVSIIEDVSDLAT
jgi:hypothetical protein